jgi:hypothetical protein
MRRAEGDFGSNRLGLADLVLGPIAVIDPVDRHRADKPVVPPEAQKPSVLKPFHRQAAALRQSAL